ncbi:unnamed protein product, partial [Ectocarpus fasciculatus]
RFPREKVFNKPRSEEQDPHKCCILCPQTYAAVWQHPQRSASAAHPTDQRHRFPTRRTGVRVYRNLSRGHAGGYVCGKGHPDRGRRRGHNTRNPEALSKGEPAPLTRGISLAQENSSTQTAAHTKSM